MAHGSDVWVVGKAEPQSYDAMVTDQPGMVIAAPGADCMPILFADPVSKVVGAAHAGGGFMKTSSSVWKCLTYSNRRKRTLYAECSLSYIYYIFIIFFLIDYRL